MRRTSLSAGHFTKNRPENGMAKTLNGVAVVLRWLAGLWLVGWALYATLRKPISPSADGTLIDVAMLLIPAAVVFAASCLAARYEKQVNVAPGPPRVGR
jgi:EamA domain-containing membrane protein RarD